MKYLVVVDGGKTTVEIFERGGKSYLREDGVETEAELRSIRDGAYVLLLGGSSVPVVASGENEELTLTIGAETWRCAVQDEREALAAAAALGGRAARKSGGVVRAVMPGIVRDVFVRVGDAVAVGAPLLVLEAMKMQNEVRSDVAGTVAEIRAARGAAVARGDALLRID